MNKIVLFKQLAFQNCKHNYLYNIFYTPVKTSILSTIPLQLLKTAEYIKTLHAHSVKQHKGIIREII